MRQEAHEKAFEINVQGQREFEAERDKLVAVGYAKKQKEFNEKMEKLTVNNKIAASAKTNETRIKRMMCRNDHLEMLREETKQRLFSELTPTSRLYVETLKQLIVQGMIRLLEADVELKVRKGEEDMVRGLIEDCQTQYSAHMLAETERVFTTKLTVIPDRFLSVEEGSEFGGVLLYAHGRRIVVANTL
jgi:V-type H+-transporting ATPase subunit E